MLFMCPGLKCGCMITRIGRVVRADPVGHSCWFLKSFSCDAHHPRSCKPAQFRPPGEAAASGLVQTTYRKSIHYLEKIKALSTPHDRAGPVFVDGLLPTPTRGRYS